VKGFLAVGITAVEGVMLVLSPLFLLLLLLEVTSSAVGGVLLLM
jgi:hypothetical protein